MLTLSIQNLSVHFSGNHVINDVSATLHGGEMVAVVGRNGVGKTTLIKAIARLIKRSGDVALYDDKGNPFFRIGTLRMFHSSNPLPAA